MDQTSTLGQNLETQNIDSTQNSSAQSYFLSHGNQVTTQPTQEAQRLLTINEEEEKNQNLQRKSQLKSSRNIAQVYPMDALKAPSSSSKHKRYSNKFQLNVKRISNQYDDENKYYFKFRIYYYSSHSSAESPQHKNSNSQSPKKKRDPEYAEEILDLRKSSKQQIDKQNTQKSGDIGEQMNPQIKAMLKQSTLKSQTSKSKSFSSQKKSLEEGDKLNQQESIGKTNANVLQKKDTITNNEKFSSCHSFDQSFDSFLLEDDIHNNNVRLRQDSRYANEKLLVFPDDPYRLFWDGIVGVCLVYTCTVIPYTIAFLEPGDDFDKEDQIISRVIDCFFGLDIILNFFTAYFDVEDNLIVSKKRIAINYLTGWLIFDFVSVFPFDIVLAEQQKVTTLVRIARLPRIYKILKIVKLSRILKLFYQRKKYTEILHDFSNLSQNLKLLFLSSFSVVLFCHICACLWFFIAKDTENQDSWVYNFHLENLPNYQKYITSFYWVVQTIATVGYGDLPAQNSTEQLIACFIMFLGVFFYSITIGSVSSLLNQLVIY